MLTSNIWQGTAFRFFMNVRQANWREPVNESGVIFWTAGYFPGAPSST